MATLPEITAGVRQLLRDFGTFFEVEQGPINVLTTRLGHPLVTGSALQVFLTDVSDPDNPDTTDLSDNPEAWTLDERNGLLKINDETYLGQRLLVAGYNYKWWTDSDLMRHTGDVLSEFLYDTNAQVDELGGVEVEVAQIGAAVRALWSLALELALDIDVSTPEGMFIPAHQRHTQVMQMLQMMEKQYEEKQAALNVGLNRLEITHLRRTARLTNRYVPLYRERELEDPYWPERVYPPIPDLVKGSNPEYDVIDVTEAYKPGGRFRSGIYPSASWPEMMGRGSWNV